ncbi:MAG: hypothetical protein LKG27_06730 [Clostridiaceae bacterium]|nr:hypothetical protein [Clostridiaceae bacterium]
MANIGITEGMGKKIVEALKQQTNVGVGPVVNEDASINMNMDDNSADVEFVEPVIEEAPAPELNNPQPDINQVFNNQINAVNSQPASPFPTDTKNAFAKNMMNFASKNDNLNDMEGIEMPTNVAVLKQLINQLPSGVTKQTGAQIIKQTMEALGISMKSVLQEAQQVQEGINNSARECQANIVEYKRQISVLEQQTQKYQKQYTILNDIISLFIQTNNY